MFGDGNDTVTHFDVGVHGVEDGEGLAYYAPNDSLLVGDRSERQIYEVTKTGTLLRIIDAEVGSYTVLSGLTVAPARDNSGRQDLWISSRGIDNGQSSSENDGKVIEISIGGPVDPPPTVSVTAPAEGATVSGASVPVTATATDNLGVTQVQFFDGTTSLGTDTNGTNGWSVTWNTTGAANGPHTIRATATDTVGQTTTDTNNVTVSNVVDTPPVVSVTAPAEGATVSGASVPVTATATDNVGVTQVQFFDGTTSLGTDTNGTNGWSVTWNTTGAANGPHTIRATATDTVGQTTTDTNNVTVSNVVDTPPVVSVTAPAEGATVSGASVPVTATATDNVGVTQVQFFDGTTSLGTDTNGADGWSVTWNTTGATDGAHTVRATATDTVGQTTTDTNNVTVDNSPPTVSITSPAAGSTVSGTTPVAANANDPQGLTSVTFFVDGTTSIGTDTNGADGWSASWNTVGATNGAHALTARASEPRRCGDDIDRSFRHRFQHGCNAGGGHPDPCRERRHRGADVRWAHRYFELRSRPDARQRRSAECDRLPVHPGRDPRGASIVNAYVQFRADETWSDPTDLTINGLASDNATAFTTAKFSLSRAVRTTAFTLWAPPAWTERQQGVNQRTSNLAPVLQEIVNRPLWASGNALALVITGSGHRVAKSFETGSPPILHIEYTTG